MSLFAAEKPGSKLSRFWHKWRFHINVLLLLVPLGFMPKYFADAALFRGDTGLGEREVGEVQVGPWSLRLAELRNEAQRLDGPAGATAAAIRSRRLTCASASPAACAPPG